MTTKLIHITSSSGHRPSYRDLFARLLDGAPSTGPIRGSCFWQLLRAHKVFFATIDDDYLGFIVVAVIRAIRRKPTTGLFLRPMECFRTERPIIYPVKRLVFRWLCKLPRMRLLSIIPHDVCPELSEVSHDWIYDPQMWDLWIDGPFVLPDTELSRRVEAARNGRKVMIFIGGASLRKGFNSFADLAEAEAENILFVSAGNISADCTLDAVRLRDLGMLVEDRFITDDELLSLYKVADLAWCSYAPEYDQASGVFGRAIQTGVEPVVREGSFLSRFHRHIKQNGNEISASSVTDALTKLNLCS